MGTLLLAHRYVTYYRGRTIILVAAITLTIYLPLAARWVMHAFQRQATLRAEATPIVIGAKGSRFGLAIHALYFRGDPPEAISMAEIERIRQTRLAAAIPLFVRFRAAGRFVVGTTPDYYGFRGLTVAQGGSIRRWGDCLLGANVAQQLGLGPGDRLLSEPENVFDLSGPAPLNMRVVGILEHTGTADDDVIFTDLETTWIIQGIGHGHDVDGAFEDSSHQHEASRANLAQHAEVTDDNLATFHFHGAPHEFPLTSIIARPDSDKSETLLMGQYLAVDETHQILRPIDVVGELMEIILQARKLFDAAILMLSAATCLLVVLVLLLSSRLRQQERYTLFRLGCSRMIVWQMLAAELLLVVLVSLLLAGGLAWGTALLQAPFVVWWFG